MAYGGHEIVKHLKTEVSYNYLC